MNDSQNIEYFIYSMMALFSALLAFWTVFLLKDNPMSGSLIFLKAGEFGRLFSILMWGVGIPGTLAIGFYFLSFAYGMPFILVSGTLTLGFMFMTYVTFRLSFIIGGD